MGELDKKEKQISQKIKQLLTDLNSGEDTKILSALKSLQVNGNVTVLRPLVELLKSELSHKVKSEVFDFLGDLKAINTVAEIISIVKDENFLEQRQEVLSTIWNSTLDYSGFIAEFVEIACDGSFMESLECLTILENLEGPFEERHILECHLHLKEYIEDTSTVRDPKKAEIMSEIAILIKDFDLNTEED